MRSNANAGASTTPTHVQGVNATSGGLIKSTLGAAVVAGAILTFVWLPAEYGIDPTGAGQVLGLTEMGEIKAQLHAEADADAAASASTAGTVTAPADVDVTGRLDAIEAQLAAIASSVGAASATAGVAAGADAAPASVATGEAAAAVETQAQAQAQAQAEAEAEAEAEAVAAEVAAVAEAAAAWRDEAEYTLTPGEGIEIKLVMDEGATAEYEWTANGAGLNHDTHGDGDGQEISYEKGRSVPGQGGSLTAAFTGNHGWFWRNRTDDDVVLTLRTRGDYESLLLP